MAPAGVEEVRSYLASIGREDCFHAVVQQGFYTSMEALRGATYEELVECGVRAAHAKLIVSSLGSGAAFSALASAPSTTEFDEVAGFLRSVGLENCLATLRAAGYVTLDQLEKAAMPELLAAGLKPVHCRLILSNLDSASTAGHGLTPVAHRMHSLTEEKSLLGGDGGRSRQSGGAKKWPLLALVALVLVLALVFSRGGGAAAKAPPKKTSPFVASYLSDGTAAYR